MTYRNDPEVGKGLSLAEFAATQIEDFGTEPVEAIQYALTLQSRLVAEIAIRTDIPYWEWMRLAAKVGLEEEEPDSRDLLSPEDYKALGINEYLNTEEEK